MADGVRVNLADELFIVVMGRLRTEFSDREVATTVDGPANERTATPVRI